MPNKGYKQSEEHKKKTSERHKGVKHSEEWKEKMKIAHKKKVFGFKVGHIPYNKGKHISEETKKKISISLKGRFIGRIGHNKGRKYPKELFPNHGMRNKEFTEETRRKMSLAHIGHKCSEETKKKMSIAKKGKKSYRYIDGRSYNVAPGRYGDDWFKIRLLIYKRDNFTCQRCALKMSKETGAFHVHHIVPFLTSFDNSLNNLTTLCPPCHRTIEAPLIAEARRRLCV